MPKQRWLNSYILIWLYIYWTHTFPKSSSSLHRKLCHVVALLLKGYFELSRLLVSDLLIFNVLFWSSIKKFKVQGSQILESWVLSFGSWVSGSRFRVLGPGSSILNLDYAFQICISVPLTFKHSEVATEGVL